MSDTQGIPLENDIVPLLENLVNWQSDQSFSPIEVFEVARTWSERLIGLYSGENTVDHGNEYVTLEFPRNDIFK
jgi:hypothetical protein